MLKAETKSINSFERIREEDLKRPLKAKINGFTEPYTENKEFTDTKTGKVSIKDVTSVRFLFDIVGYDSLFRSRPLNLSTFKMSTLQKDWLAHLCKPSTEGKTIDLDLLIGQEVEIMFREVENKNPNSRPYQNIFDITTKTPRNIIIKDGKEEGGENEELESNFPDDFNPPKE
jgi:hypothetical protein